MLFNVYDIKQPGPASEKDVAKYMKKQNSETEEVRKRLISYAKAFPNERKLSTALVQALSYADYLLGITHKQPELSPAAVDFLDGIGSCENHGEAGLLTEVWYITSQKEDLLRVVGHMLEKENESIKPEDLERLKQKRKEMADYVTMLYFSSWQPTNYI